MCNEKLNRAIRECLERCYHSDNTGTCLTEFLRALLCKGDWAVPEVREVRSKMLQTLRKVMSSRYPYYQTSACVEAPWFDSSDARTGSG
jgi:hypothetical protein